jgi:hypothetical protein
MAAGRRDGRCCEVPKPNDVTDRLPGGGTARCGGVLTPWWCHGAMGRARQSDRLCRRGGADYRLNPPIRSGGAHMAIAIPCARATP